MSYPILEIDYNKILHNASQMQKKCANYNVSVSGVIKGMNGAFEIAEAFTQAQHKYLASSRLRELKIIADSALDIPLMLIRIPMLSEIDEMIQYVDISVNSELEVIKAIEKACRKYNKKHKVILMMDLGDLREGYFLENEILEVAKYIEFNLEHVELYGIGTNLSCYGSVMPTTKNMTRLVSIAESIENIVNRKLDIISGGATTSIPLLLEGDMPKRINNLRIGEGILLAVDLQDFHGLDMSDFYQDAILLKAEIIEIKTKDSYPVGKLSIDAFGNKPTYTDSGKRKRALLALGKKDIGSHEKLIVIEPGIKIIGSSSDHLIVDIDEAEKKYNVGDIMSFRLYYPAMLYSSQSPDVEKKFINLPKKR